MTEKIVMKRSYKDRMADPTLIEHAGIIRDIQGNILKIGIKPVSACGACQSKGSCPIPEAIDEKIIDVIDPSSHHAVGDSVTITFEARKGSLAVWIGYLLPLILVILALVAGMAFFHHEIIAGLLALGIMIPYYGILYCLRSRFKQVFIFRLKDT